MFEGSVVLDERRFVRTKACEIFGLAPFFFLAPPFPPLSPMHAGVAGNNMARECNIDRDETHTMRDGNVKYWYFSFVRRETLIFISRASHRLIDTCNVVISRRTP
jgi:hypothetical protein